MPQLRKFTRFTLRVPVVFGWTDQGGEHAGRGVTSNISAGGMFIVSSICPPTSSVVHCEMLLPSPSAKGIEEFEGRAIGSVVRSQQSGENGFAVFSNDFVVRHRR
jgi:hypothetical protein